MASNTLVLKRRRKMKAAKRGRKRKNRLQRQGTTPSRAEVFGDAPGGSGDAQQGGEREQG